MFYRINFPKIAWLFRIPIFQMRRPFEEKIWYSSRVRVVLHHWVFLASTTPLINGLFGPPIIYTRSDIERSAFAKKQKLFFYFSESLGIDHSCINTSTERFFWQSLYLSEINGSRAIAIKMN